MSPFLLKKRNDESSEIVDFSSASIILEVK